MIKLTEGAGNGIRYCIVLPAPVQAPYSISVLSFSFLVSEMISTLRTVSLFFVH